MVNEWYLVAFWQDLKIKIHLIHNYSFQKVKRLGPLHLAKKVISWSPPPLSEENGCRLAWCCRICRICSHKVQKPDIKYSHNQNISPDLISYNMYYSEVGVIFYIMIKK